MDVITFPENLLTTSGLSILLHCVILLPDATSYDNTYFYLILATSADSIEMQLYVAFHLSFRFMKI